MGTHWGGLPIYKNSKPYSRACPDNNHPGSLGLSETLVRGCGSTPPRSTQIIDGGGGAVVHFLVRATQGMNGYESLLAFAVCRGIFLIHSEYIVLSASRYLQLRCPRIEGGFASA